MWYFGILTLAEQEKNAKKKGIVVFLTIEKVGISQRC